MEHITFCFYFLNNKKMEKHNGQSSPFLPLNKCVALNFPGFINTRHKHNTIQSAFEV